MEIREKKKIKTISEVSQKFQKWPYKNKEKKRPTVWLITKEGVLQRSYKLKKIDVNKNQKQKKKAEKIVSQT